MLFSAKKLLNAQAREHVRAGAMARGLFNGNGGLRGAGACLPDGNGGLRAAAAWRLLMDQVDLMDQMDKMGAPCDTPWVCMPLSGLARAKIYRRGMPGFFDGNGGMHVAGA